MSTGYEDWQIIRFRVPFFAFKDRRLSWFFSWHLPLLGAIPVGYYPYPDWVSLAFFWEGDQDSSHSYLPYSVWGLCPLYCERHGCLPKYGQIHCEKSMNDLDGVIFAQARSFNLLQKYKVKAEKRIIPTGDYLATGSEITPTETAALREKYEVAEDETFFTSLMKRISGRLLRLFRFQVNSKVALIRGWSLSGWFENKQPLGVSDAIIFTGMQIQPNETALYYKAVDFFTSASTSETQGRLI